jgi:hypothetical protein
MADGKSETASLNKRRIALMSRRHALEHPERQSKDEGSYWLLRGTMRTKSKGGTLRVKRFWFFFILAVEQFTTVNPSDFILYCCRRSPSRAWRARIQD